MFKQHIQIFAYCFFRLFIVKILSGIGEEHVWHVVKFIWLNQTDDGAYMTLCKGIDYKIRNMIKIRYDLLGLELVKLCSMYRINRISRGLCIIQLIIVFYVHFPKFIVWSLFI